MPPLVEAVAEPLLPPKQAGFVAVIETEILAELPITPVAVTVHPLASVAVTV